MGYTLFISDLHLQEARPDILGAFFMHIQQHRTQLDALYILGDFFELWYGDDVNSALHQSVEQFLHGLSAQGIPIYFQHGNRDFALGKQYAQRAGMQLLAAEQTIMLYGQPVLLLHGDQLCTDDVAYQRYRARWRNPVLIDRLARLPRWVRAFIAHTIRRKSVAQLPRRVIADVNQQAVMTHFEQYNVQRMIHGHTHRQALHVHPLSDGREGLRYVLGDWDRQTSSLQVMSTGQWVFLNHEIVPQ